MLLREAIDQRYSVRGYLDKPVSKETLQEVLAHGMKAISSVNCQP